MVVMHQQAKITVTELVAAIERSSLLTVLVEGRDDMSIYNGLYSWDSQVSIVQTQGRCTLLKTFIAAKEKGLLNKCIFIADRDLYVFEGIPPEYRDIIFTTGYSIENDVVADCKMIKNLLQDIGQRAFNSGRHLLSKWFAFYVEQHLQNKPAKADVHPLALLKDNGCGEFEENPGGLLKQEYLEPAASLVDDIEKNFSVKFRGKNLVHLISVSFLAAHKVDSKVLLYKEDQIINIAINSETQSAPLKNLQDRLRSKLESLML